MGERYLDSYVRGTCAGLTMYIINTQLGSNHPPATFSTVGLDLFLFKAPNNLQSSVVREQNLMQKVPMLQSTVLYVRSTYSFNFAVICGCVPCIRDKADLKWQVVQLASLHYWGWVQRCFWVQVQ